MYAIYERTRKTRHEQRIFITFHITSPRLYGLRAHCKHPAGFPFEVRECACARVVFDVITLYEGNDGHLEVFPLWFWLHLELSKISVYMVEEII